MDRNEVESIVEKINSFLNSKLWMDFEITQYTNYKLLITGSIDPSSINSDIEIEFQEVYYASMLFNWETDTSIQAIELVSESEAEEMYFKYKIERGTYIFKFYPEDYSSDVEFYVCAKNISYVVNK